MVQNFLWKADNYSTTQPMLCCYRKSRFLTLVTKIHHWTFFCASTIYLTSVSLMTPFDITFLSLPRLRNWSVPLRLSNRILCKFFTFRIHYLTYISHPLLCSFPNIRWGLQIEVCQYVISTLKLSFPLLCFISDV